MVTTVDTKVAAKLYPKVQLYGVDATFRTYPSESPDYDESNVSPGTPTDYTVKVTPPDFTSGGEVLDEDEVEGGEDERERCIIWLPTANGTANAIAFTPVREMEVQVMAKWWSIIKVIPVPSGDLIAAYGLHLAD